MFNCKSDEVEDHPYFARKMLWAGMLVISKTPQKHFRGNSNFSCIQPLSGMVKQNCRSWSRLINLSMVWRPRSILTLRLEAVVRLPATRSDLSLRSDVWVGRSSAKHFHLFTFLMTHFKLRVSLKKKELLVFCFSQVGVEGFYSVLQHKKMGRLEHRLLKKASKYWGITPTLE